MIFLSVAKNRKGRPQSAEMPVITTTRSFYDLVFFLTVTIFISAFFSGVAASAQPVSGVSVSPSNLVLERGTAQILQASLTPADAANQDVRWISSNTGVVKVTPEGALTARVSAVSAGTAAVTVLTVDGEKKASSQVTVVVPVDGVALNLSEATMVRGNTEVLVATVSPADATNKAVRWESSDENVVRVVPGDGHSVTIRAYEQGVAEVAVITEDGNRRASVQVEVVVLVTNLLLDTHEATLAPGDVIQLEASIFPENATDQRLNWESSDNGVAYVDEKGRVEARSVGEARIVAISVDNSSAYDYVVVTVQDGIGAPANDEELQEAPGEARPDEINGPSAVDETPEGESERTGEQDDLPTAAGPPGPGRSPVVFYVILGGVLLVLVLAGLFYVVKKR